MSKFLHDDAKAIAIPQIFSKNSRAENGHNIRAMFWGLTWLQHFASFKFSACPRIIF